MAAIMKAEVRKGWTKLRRHRQKHFWSQGYEGRWRHLASCDRCCKWRIEMHPEKGSNF